MKWVGITGGLGTGKSTVARCIREAGYPVLDADDLARFALGPGSPLLEPIRSKFGEEIFNKDGSLNRKALGQKVFVSKEDLQWLESLIHPEVQRKVAKLKSELKAQGEKLAFYDVPLLFEKGLQKNFDVIVVVAVSKDKAKVRVVSRDGLSDQEIEERMANQLPMQEKIKNADFVIFNDGSLSELKTKVLDLISQLNSHL